MSGRSSSPGSRVVTGSLVLTLTIGLVAGCSTEMPAPTAATPAGISVGGTASFDKGQVKPEELEMVVITPAALPAVGQSGRLVATACEPGVEHKKRPTACPDGWVVDTDAKLTWSTTDASRATVTKKGLVSHVSSDPVAIIAYSSDNGGACAAVGNLPGPVFYDVVTKKSVARLQCTYVGDPGFPI